MLCDTSRYVTRPYLSYLYIYCTKIKRDFLLFLIQSIHKQCFRQDERQLSVVMGSE